jgi:hypothetical protein
MSDRTFYSEKIKGHPANYRWAVRFDVTGGFLGIDQWHDDGPMERVLLSPEQVRALVKFYKAHPARKRAQRVG